MFVNDDDEILDLVDENDNIIGRIKRSDAYAADLHNFRVINVFLQNKEGQLWIPRRTACKKLYPLYLDASVGGHVSSGETYEQAFIRESQEEIGIDIRNFKYQDLGQFVPHKHGVSAFMHVYTFFYHKVHTFNEEDFVEYFWLTPAELKIRLQKGDHAKTDLPILLDLIQL
jgi:isopentenyldiphosphate isomerase